jgi:hypothetical protein
MTELLISVVEYETCRLSRTEDGKAVCDSHRRYLCVSRPVRELLGIKIRTNSASLTRQIN